MNKSFALCTLLSLSVSGFGMTITNTTSLGTTYIPIAGSAKGECQLQPDPAMLLTPNGNDAALLKLKILELFPDWTVNFGTPLTGNANIAAYIAGMDVSPTDGVTPIGIRGSFTYTYTGPGVDHLRFLQVVKRPGSFKLDMKGNFDLPFYWTEAEYQQVTKPGVTGFDDNASAAYAGYFQPAPGPYFTGDTFLADWDGVKTLTLHEGIQWGFQGMLLDPNLYGAGNNNRPAVPEPASILGLGALVFIRRRKS